jgi:hypothetical protein
VSVDRDAATMADQTKKATGVPLTNIAVLLALLGGVAFYRLPLTSRGLGSSLRAEAPDGPDRTSTRASGRIRSM